jgi:zinc protease
MLSTALVLSLLASAPQTEVAIPHQKFVLGNGLEVVIHEDHSDPVVAVYLYYHVGSGRETPGRSGFAHLFEHMLFQGSEHVGDDQHFKLVSEAGGTLNGSTTTDRTNYYEVLPSNQLELALWLESDRMGYLLPAVTQAKLDNQRDVVKNERRQNYENRPYGQSEQVICSALYPPDHPYSWLTIGTHEDLTAASLEDVKSFFARWYGPNNATLAIGGDVDTKAAIAMVEKYFGSIPRGPSVDVPKPRPAELAGSRRIVTEDKVKLPQLDLVWPAVPQFSADDAALDLLASMLANNDSSVLRKALTIDAELASSVSAANESEELAGKFSITVRANPKVTLDALEKEVDRLLTELADKGVDPDHVQRAKTRYEAGFVRRLETVQSRTSALANYNVFLGAPDYYRTDLARHLAVSADDVRRVLRQYLVGKPRIAVSIVPKGKTELAASGSSADHAWQAPPARPEPDRAKKPAPNGTATFRSPAVWHGELENGVRVVGTRWSELPLSTLTLSVPAGQAYDTMPKLGLSSLTAEMLEQGTKKLSVVGLAEALDALGASINVRADDDELRLSVSALDQHLPAAMALLADMVLTPRFAPEDFERLKKERLVAIDTRGDQIRAVAGDAYRRLLWGDTVLGAPGSGTRDTVSKLSLADVQEFWRTHAVPAGSRIVYVGGQDAAGVQKLCAPLVAGWKKDLSRGAPPRPEFTPVVPTATRLYLIDKPEAAQSEIRIGHPGVRSSDPSFYPLTVLNYALGGAFSSRINLNLREDKGYTYGARTSFEGGTVPGPFTASAGVKTEVTAPSVVEFMKELVKIQSGITEAELASTKDALLQSATRQYESTRALAELLDNVGKYGWPDDYVDRRLAQLKGLTVPELAKLASSSIHPDRMVILVVGDKAKIAGDLAGLGYGEPVELDLEGKPLAKPAGSQ